MYEESDAMISVCDSHEFVPYGRHYMAIHPGKLASQSKGSEGADHGLPIVKALREFTLSSSVKKDHWLLRRSTDRGGESCEEELYIDENTVVWSFGGVEGAGQVIKSFTMDSPVQEALWCSFLLPVDEVPSESNEGGEVLAQKQTGVAIIESNNVSVFTTEGKDYITAVPFNLAKTWSIQGGLLFERSTVEKTSPVSATPEKKDSRKIPVLFSMMHPLDDIAPVICKTSGSAGATKVSYVTETTHQIVYTHESPSLVMTYDRTLSAHSIWIIRRAKPEEVCSVYNAGGDIMMDFDPIGSVTPGVISKSTSAYLSSCRLTNSSQSPSLASPFRSLQSRTNTPSQINSKLQSPSLSQLNALSRTQSPLTSSISGTAARLQFSSPGVTASGLKSSPAAGRTPLSFANSSVNGAGPGAMLSGVGAQVQDTSIRPLEGIEPLPELCLEHLWTETVTNRDGIAGIAKRVFMHTDLCGQRYICYLITFRNQLKLVKCEESNDRSQLIVGASSTLCVQDVVPLPALNMLLLLDMASNLVLYSGLVKINKVHMWSLPTPQNFGQAQTPARDHIQPTSSLRNSPVRFPHLAGFTSATGDNGGPGGPVTSSRPPSALDARFDLDDDMAMLSPVPTEFNESSNQILDSSLTEELSFQQPRQPATMITNIRDPVENRFTVELTNGSLFRASLALDSNLPLIKLSIEALKQILPREAVFAVLIRWYSAYNTPGSVNGQSEWTRFSRCLLALMGYDVTQIKLTQKNYDSSMPNTPKKSRPSDQGTAEDWTYLLESGYHEKFHRSQGNVLRVNTITEELGADPITTVSLDNSAILFQHIPSILWALHLVYEELKLHSLVGDELECLAQLLHQLATDLHCVLYADHYARDWPSLFAQNTKTSAINQEFLQQMNRPSFFSMMPPRIYDWIYGFLKGLKPDAYPYLHGVNDLTKYSISMLVVMFSTGDVKSITWSDHIRKVSRAGQRSPDFEESITQFSKHISPGSSMHEKVVLFVTNCAEIINRVAGSISLVIKEAINHCRENPPADWPKGAYDVIGREDLAKQKEINTDISPRCHIAAQALKSGAKQEEDGMEYLDKELLGLRFHEDLRVNEVRRLLQSAKPARVDVVQRPEVSDHEHIEDQERALYAICIRTMALPTGRGMFTLSTYHPVPTETVPVPKLCLTGRAPPRNTTVDLTHIDTPANMNHWPLFNNGVAAGLRIGHSSQLDSTWILYNKPKSNDLTNEHAGFLMGLGLNGHLSSLATLNVHDYLCRGHEMTSVGLILGIAAGKRGTMDMTTTKLLSIHVAALLPPTSTELDVPHNVEVAAILGVGLVYQGTAHRHIAQVLLNEIGRPPGPEMENCADRESYSLAAGLGLGMVMLGKGRLSTGLADLNMADQLYHYMVGGHKRPLTGAHKSRIRAPSYQIKEGDCVNTDVTAPGAILALGMMFFKTNSSAVAEWLAAPDTQFVLDLVRPDMLMLRTISRGLVLWDSVHPSTEWINSNIPELVQKYAFSKEQQEAEENGIDIETMSQACCHIMAGACMALALKFAGSANQEAFTCLRSMADQMLKLMNKSLVDQAGKSSVESCLVVIVLSLAMVMSGTGNLEVLRLCRHLRSRVGGWYNHVLYGSHMAVTMAIGLLFLGGGRYTLSTEPQAIAAMLSAFFPKFPIHSNDNRYHLQAFRHLYVLAAEPRVIVPRDVITGKLCYVPIEVVFKGSDVYDECSFDAMAPCLLPHLSLLKEVRVKGPRYWPVSFNISSNWKTLKEVLQNTGFLHVKQRAGHLSYLVDPQGYHSVLSQSLTTEHALGKIIGADDIQSFSSDPNILAFAEIFCTYSNKEEFGMTQFLSKVLNECVSHEKLQVLPLFISLKQLTEELVYKSKSVTLQNLRIIMAFYEKLAKSQRQTDDFLLNMEFFTHLQSVLDTHLSKWLSTSEGKRCLKQYLSVEPMTEEDSFLMLSIYLAWYSVPHPSILIENGVTDETSFPDMFMKLKDMGMSVSGVMALARLLLVLRP